MFTKEPFINKVLSKCLEKLHGAREFYLNEDDFKFSFALALSECGAQEVILEYPISAKDLYSGRTGINAGIFNGDRSYIDVRFKYCGQEIFIELKYKQLETDVTRYNQDFWLKTQSAQNVGLYAVHLDIERMEAIKNSSEHRGCLAYCILITNDESYKKPHNGAVNKRLALCHGDNMFYSNKGSNEYNSGKRKYRTLIINNSYETNFVTFKDLSPHSKNSQFWITVIDLQQPL